MAGEAIRRLLDSTSVGPGTRVLEVCSRPGYGTAAALDPGAQAVGFDFSAAMPNLNTATRTNRGRGSLSA